MTEDDYEVLERLMTKHCIKKRSEMIRHLLRVEGEAALNRDIANLGGEPVIAGTAVAASVRNAIAEISGVPAVTGADYPGMGVAGYELALIIAQNHMAEILAGTIPMVYDDAHAAGLEPYGRKAWMLYMVALPEFFRVVLELAEPPAADMRYGPLEVVDGQYAGAVKGEVLSSSQVYPDNDTAKYAKLEVQAGRQVVPVLVPAGLGCGDIEVGATVYAGGAFTVIRQNVVMRACKCVVVRPDGFDAVYDLVERWGLDDQAADGVIRVLRRCHGDQATEFAPVFEKYTEIDQESAKAMRVLEMPAGGRLPIKWSDVRSEPPGPEAVRECTRLWSRIFGRMEPDDIIYDDENDKIPTP